MLRLYYVCFATGVAYAVISFLLGQLFDFIDFDGDVDLDGGSIGSTISPLKPIVIASFVTVFGGIGIIGTMKGLLWSVTLGVAFGVAFLIAYGLYRWVIIPLYKAQNTSAVEQQSLIGCIAKVTLGMKAEEFGRITYVVNGNTYTAPAKSEGGEQLGKGTEVVITGIVKNVFYIKKV